MRRHVRWLIAELPGLEAAGVLDAATADRLRAHYAAHAGSDRRSLTLAVFGTLGATLVGAGVILLVGANWETLDRPARAALALGLLVVVQVLGAFAAVARPRSVAWTEATGSLWALGLGASLALVSQTYHLEGEPHAFLGTWMVLGLPIVYVLRSRLAGTLYLVGTCGWVLAAPTDALQDRIVLWLGAVLPFVVAVARGEGARRDHVLGWAAMAAALTAAAVAGDVLDGVWPIWLACLLGALAAGADLPRTVPGWAVPARLTSHLGGALLGLALTWPDAWPRDAIWIDTGSELLWSILGGALALGSLLGVVRAVALHDPARAVGPALPLLVGVGWVLDRSAGAGALWANVAVGLTGVGLLVDGIARQAPARANAGLGLVAALAVVRFFDAEVSLVVRGLAFVAIGVGFLVANLRVRRAPEGAP